MLAVPWGFRKGQTMSETRVMRDNRGRFKKVDGYTCQECGVWGAYGEYHSILFCWLHQKGWDRQTIIDEIHRASAELRGSG